MKELAREHWNYILYEKETGELILDVICGSVAIYTKQHILSDAEREAFEADGQTYLKSLADFVRNKR